MTNVAFVLDYTIKAYRAQSSVSVQRKTRHWWPPLSFLGFHCHLITFYPKQSVFRNFLYVHSSFMKQHETISAIRATWR